MASIHPGSWTIGGYRLPDLGITEFLSGNNRTAQGGSNLFGNQQANTNQVLGINDQAQNQNQNTNTGGTRTITGGATGALRTVASPTPTSIPQSNTDPYASLRGDISSGWDSYLSGLGGMLSGLDSQRASQEAIAQSQYDQGINTLTGQLTEGTAGLNLQRERTTDNQAKTLRDLSSNLRNSFLAGNIYLGSRGAGDSSASDQYSYALNKVGTRARSDVMGQTADVLKEIDNREFQLKNTFDTESKNLLALKDQKINEVATWFADAQNRVREMQAQGQLGKSQDLAGLSRDILNRALGEVDRINQEARSKQTALEEWAMNNSNTIQGLRANMSSISQFAPNLPVAQAISGTPTVDSTGNLRVQTGYGAGTDERRRDLFGNPIA